MEPALSFELFTKRLKEKYSNESRIVAVLFARYGVEISDKLISESLKYMNLNTGEALDIYMPGYGRYKFSPEDLEDGEELVNIKTNKTGWYFSTYKFIDFKRVLESETGWEYNDEVEVIFFNYYRGNIKFDKFLSVNLERAVESRNISTIRSFFESVTRLVYGGVYTINELSNKLLYTYGKDCVLDFIWDNIPGGLGKYGKRVADFSVRK